jgi:hypothetical protein
MSLGVSQIDYWRQKSQPPVGAKAPPTPASKEYGGPGAQYLSYSVFLGLTVLGGFLALDHLYLRSPMTFLAKFIVNILCFGVWWLYDVSQAIFNKDVVKVFGLPVPGMGPRGIGAGVFASETPDRKHLAFLIYGLSLIFGGIFGMDSFIVGDKTSGIIRLISFVTIIFAPVAIGWWLYGLFKFFFSTRDVTDKYWEYFGAPKPHEDTLSTTEWLVYKFPFLSYIFGPIRAVKDAIAAPINLVKEVVTNPSIIVTGPVGEVATAAAEAVAVVAKPLVNELSAAVNPVVNVVTGAEGIVQSGIDVVGKGVNVAGNVVATAKEAVGTLGPLATVASEAMSTTVPSAASLTEAATKLKMDGGGGLLQNTSVLGFTLMGVISIIAVSGMVLTYLRSRKTNGRPERDDSPPKPGILRVPNKEKSISST